MNPADFTPQAPWRLVRIREDHWAFVPNPLPPGLEFDLATVALLSEADHALGELAGLGTTLPNPRLLIRPFLRREAVLSSRIEGTQTELEQLLLFELDPLRRPEPPDVQEVVNYVRALEYGLQRLQTLPICLRLIRELHERLLAGVRGRDQRPGEFRTEQNFIGRPGTQIEAARFVPPPVEEMRAALNDLEHFIGSESELPVLVHVALVHYQFEAIHPFRDGNGRIGRLLIPLQLCQRGRLPQPVLSLSAYFERHRDEYMDHLLRVSQAGEWLSWIQFFLRGVTEQARDAIRRSQRLLALWMEYRQRLQAVRASGLLLQLVEDLFAMPYLSAPDIQRRHHVTHRTAQLNIQKLMAAGIVREVSNQQRGRLYQASEVLSILTAPEG